MGQDLNILGPDFSRVEQHPVVDRSSLNFLREMPFDVDNPAAESTIPEPLSPETMYASRSSYDSAREDEARIPSQGECMYLMIEDNFAENIARQRRSGDQDKDPHLGHFLNQLTAIYDSDNFCITRQNGYILIVDTAERAGSYLTSLATSIFIASRGCSKALVGPGRISHSKDGDSFNMSGTLPTREETSSGEVFTLEPGIYLHTTIYDPARKRLKGRDGAANRTVAQAGAEGAKWLRLKEHKPSVELAVGGPDKFVGYEEELTILDSVLNDDTTKLTVLRAAAGMGKSRLLAEVAKTNPSMLVMSLDPSGKNVQGNGLVTFTEQLIQYVETNANVDDPSAKSILAAVTKFRRMSQPQRIKLAQKNPQQLVALCQAAFKFLRSKLGQLKVVLDDVHHVDNHSDAYIMDMMSSLISGDSQNKVVLSMRPEERYDSAVQKKFETQVRTADRRAVKNVNLEGLDFTNESIARDFIFHSLPEEFRKGKTLGGDWWKKLGQQAGKLPLAMMTFMDAIMAEHDRLTAESKPSVLTDPEGQIMLSEIFLEQLMTSIPDGDLGRYYKERVNKLPGHLKVFMQSIALLGGEVTSVQLRQIEGVTGRISQSDLDNVLIRGRYLIQSGGKYKVQHQTIVDGMVQSIDYKQRVDLSMDLYRAFNTDESISNDTKLALLHNVAPHATFRDNEFWAEYGRRVSLSLEDAKKRKAYGKSYGTAMTIVGAPLAKIDEIPEEERTVMQRVLTILQTPDADESVDSMKIWLVVTTLERLGEGAMMLGKFGEAEVAFQKLDKILVLLSKGTLKHQQTNIRNLFELAYLQKNVSKMEELYATKIPAVFAGREHDGLKAVMELKIAYAKAFFAGGNIDEGVQKINDLYAQKASLIGGLRMSSKAEEQGGEGDLKARKKREEAVANHGAYLEISRLIHCRVPFELIRGEVLNVRLSEHNKRLYDQRKKGLAKPERRELLRAMGNKRQDEDILYQRAIFDTTQLTTLMDIDAALQALMAQQKTNPDAFNPHARMSLLDIKAQVASMLGRPQEAVDLFSEYWRQANQMEIHGDASRAAKIKGDIQMIQAFAGHNPELKRHNIDRNRVIEAIRTYSEEGIKSLTSVDPKSVRHMSMRLNRIRAIGALAMSYDYEIETRNPGPEEIKQMVQEFTPRLETALEDFNYLNEKIPEGANDGEAQYCLMGYLGHIFKFAKKRGLPLPDIIAVDKYPYMSEEGLRRANAYAEELEDNSRVDLGERARKMMGIAAMKEFIGLDISLELDR